MCVRYHLRYTGLDNWNDYTSTGYQNGNSTHLSQHVRSRIPSQFSESPTTEQIRGRLHLVIEQTLHVAAACYLRVTLLLRREQNQSTTNKHREKIDKQA